MPPILCTYYKLLLVVALVLGTGCSTVNTYSKFYESKVPPGSEHLLMPATGTVLIKSAELVDLRSTVADFEEKGYRILGASSFISDADREMAALMAHAKSVGADLVIVGAGYHSTESGVRPVLTYNPGTTTTTRNQGSSYSTASGGGVTTSATGNYQGTTTTRTPGTFGTENVAYSNSRFEHHAIFMRRGHFVFGARFRALNDDERRALQRNGGVVVDGLVEDSPAFESNLIVGDVIIAIDGEPIRSRERFGESITELAGRMIRLTVIRAGQERAIDVKLNPARPLTSGSIGKSP